MKVLVFFCALALTLADEDGNYVPDNSGQYVPNDDEGRYIHDDSGRYIHDGTGNYKDDGTGRYAGDGSGIYSGQNDVFKRDSFLGSGSTIKTVNEIKTNPIRLPTVHQRPYRQPQPLNYNSNLQDGKWKIIRQVSDIDTDGYHWEYETENKIIAEESGKVHNVGTDNEVMRAKGFFQYTGPDNVVYSVVYTADENGFVPTGDHLPTPPPLPEAIVKALEFNSRAENKV